MLKKKAYQGHLEHVTLSEQALKAVLLLSNQALGLVYCLNVLVQGCSGEGPFQLLPTGPLLLVYLQAPTMQDWLQVLCLSSASVFIKLALSRQLLCLPFSSSGFAGRRGGAGKRGLGEKVGGWR